MPINIRQWHEEIGILNSYKCKTNLNTNLSTIFFNCFLAAIRPTLGHSQGDSFTNPMLITAF